MNDPEVLREFRDRVDPAHTALLVVDMQNDFCAKGGHVEKVMRRDVTGCEEIALAIMGLVAAARKTGVPVFWIKAVYDPKYITGPMQLKQIGTGVESICCAEGSWGAELYMVEPEEGEPVIVKHRYSAFSGTILDNLLRVRGVKSLVVTGVATNICIDSTFRDGFHNGFYVVIPKDCVGAANKELHEATLKNVQFLFGDVVESRAVIDEWGRSNARAAQSATRSVVL